MNKRQAMKTTATVIADSVAVDSVRVRMLAESVTAAHEGETEDQKLEILLRKSSVPSHYIGHSFDDTIRMCDAALDFAMETRRRHALPNGS